MIHLLACQKETYLIVHVCFKDAAIMIVIILKTSFKPEVSSSYVVMDKTKKEL